MHVIEFTPDSCDKFDQLTREDTIMRCDDIRAFFSSKYGKTIIPFITRMVICSDDQKVQASTSNSGFKVRASTSYSDFKVRASTSYSGFKVRASTSYSSFEFRASTSYSGFKVLLCISEELVHFDFRDISQ